VSSREDRGRYRGRRRAPAPPRTRYAAVGLTAFVGAGVVALGTAAALPGTSSDSTGLTAASASGAFTASDLADRQATADRANRATDRANPAALDNADTGLWLLPLRAYTVATPFGAHGASAHPGMILAAREGAPFVASHAGTVVLARWAGGTGNTVVIDVGNGTRIVYGNSARLMVKEGQHVEAGDVIGLVGSTGYAFGSQLFYQVERNGAAIDPVGFMLARGVDLAKATQAIDG
jgi:murein DD-endopeptidase MepM/ murein hydrolase activator NlpD